MFKISFLGKTERYLGIDIGTASVKVVELSSSKKGVTLENYGERINRVDEKNIQGELRKKAFFSSDEEVAASIKDILDEAKIKTKEAIFSIPDFMSFFTVFTIPPMPKDEISSVVQFEARQHIPLSLQEMTLDWSLIDDKDEKDSKKRGHKVLLVAVPNKMIQKYQKIAQMAGITVSAIEAEVFSLARAAIKPEDMAKTVQLIDIGVQSTTITMIRDGVIRATYSVDFAVGEIIKDLAGILKISYNEAEKMIREKGLEDEKIGEFLQLQVGDLASESKQVSANYFKHEKRETDKIIVAGGTALMTGLPGLLTRQAGKPTETVDPFSNIAYPPILEDVIKEMGPRYSVVVGLTLRYIENKK